MKALAFLLILSLVAFTFVFVQESAAGCWGDLLGCLASAYNSYDNCIANWNALGCAKSLYESVKACHKAYDSCT